VKYFWDSLSFTEKVSFSEDSPDFHLIRNYAAKDKNDFIRMLAVVQDPTTLDISTEISPLVRAAYFSAFKMDLVFGMEESSHADRILIIGLKLRLYGLNEFLNFILLLYEKNAISGDQAFESIAALANNKKLMRDFEDESRIGDGIDFMCVSNDYKTLWMFIINFPENITRRMAFRLPIGNRKMVSVPVEVMSNAGAARALVDRGYSEQINFVIANPLMFSDQLLKDSIDLNKDMKQE
jgi:hypothetical protein